MDIRLGRWLAGGRSTERADFSHVSTSVNGQHRGGAFPEERGKQREVPGKIGENNGWADSLGPHRGGFQKREHHGRGLLEESTSKNPLDDEKEE